MSHIRIEGVTSFSPMVPQACFCMRRQVYQHQCQELELSIPRSTRPPFQFKLQLSFNNQVIKTLASYFHTRGQCMKIRAPRVGGAQTQTVRVHSLGTLGDIQLMV